MLTIRVARGGGGGAGSPPLPTWNATNDKMSHKRLLFFQFQFLLASSRTTVINNNIDPGGPGPFNLFLPINLEMPPTIIFKWPQFKWIPNNNIVPRGPGPFNLMFTNQFKRITRVKVRVFILKVANWGPHITFYERNAITINQGQI